MGVSWMRRDHQGSTTRKDYEETIFVQQEGQLWSLRVEKEGEGDIFSRTRLYKDGKATRKRN